MKNMYVCLNNYLRAGLLLILLFLLPAISSIEQKKWKENKASLFIFGDSLYDAGANNYIETTADYRANFRPYGQTYFDYPTGRFSDGRLIPDFIAEYAGLELIPPYLHPDFKFNGGANFASAGAGVLVETNAGFVSDLKTQLMQFEKLQKELMEDLGNEAAKKAISNAVYMFSVGSNDYCANNSTLHLFLSRSHDEYVAMVIRNLTDILRRIHSKGGRKFGFISMPMGSLPQRRGTPGSRGACLNDINKLVEIHNAALPKALEKLETHLDGFKYSIFDLYHVLLQKINNPTLYGFVEGEKACCGAGPYGGVYSCGGQRSGEKEYELCDDPNEHVFFDSVHPTERAYEQLAKSMWSGGHDIVWPYNLKALFIKKYSC